MLTAHPPQTQRLNQWDSGSFALKGRAGGSCPTPVSTMGWARTRDVAVTRPRAEPQAAEQGTGSWDGSSNCTWHLSLGRGEQKSSPQVPCQCQPRLQEGQRLAQGLSRHLGKKDLVFYPPSPIL